MTKISSYTYFFKAPLGTKEAAVNSNKQPSVPRRASHQLSLSK